MDIGPRLKARLGSLEVIREESVGGSEEISNMGVSTESSNAGERWGMGYLLVFFPKKEVDGISKNKNLVACSRFPEWSDDASKNGTRSGRLLRRARATASICTLLVLSTFLVFALCTIEPDHMNSVTSVSRRWLSVNEQTKIKQARTTRATYVFNPWSFLAWRRSTSTGKVKIKRLRVISALQGMGVLYRRGTTSMSDLLVGHVPEDTTHEELRLFLRILHMSCVVARSDMVFLFDSSSSAQSFRPLIEEENRLFLQLVLGVSKTRNDSTSRVEHPRLFNYVSEFAKDGVGKSDERKKEPLWGNRRRIPEEEKTDLVFGSMVGFEAAELDPENSLGGFFRVAAPLSLRRWACYPMLLGRVRRSFKRVMLVDVKNSAVLHDPFSQLRDKKPESIFFWAKSADVRHSGPIINIENTTTGVTPALIGGGLRGVRRLSNAILVDIIRAASQPERKRRQIPTESAMLNGIVNNRFLVNHLNLLVSTQTILEPGSLRHSLAGELSRHAPPLMLRDRQLDRMLQLFQLSLIPIFGKYGQPLDNKPKM